MKHLKMMGLAVLAVLALTAVAGAGTASASATVCSTNTSPCTGILYGAGTKITAQLAAGSVATLTTSIGNVVCKKSTVAGVLTGHKAAEGEKPTIPSGHGEITGLTFTECVLTPFFGNPTNCTVTAINLNYTVTAVATGGGNGDLTITAKGSQGPPGATVVCGSLINCSFTSSHLVLDVTGGNPALVHAKEEELSRTGGLCPSTSKWDATYEVTSPKPLFLTV